jgi:hypothetical protein
MEVACNPQCCCGGEMKKLYSKPTVKKLDFKRTALEEVGRTNN